MKIAKAGSAICFALLMTVAPGARAGDSASVPAASAVAPAASIAGSGGATSSKAADRALRRHVLTALARAKGLQASGITVHAHDGEVLLEGWVPETAQIDQATKVTQAVPGVTSVKNTLSLSTF